MISAITGAGIDALLARIEHDLQSSFTRVSYRLKQGDGKLLAWLHANGKVVEQTAEDDYIDVIVQLSEDNIRRFERLQHENIL